MKPEARLFATPKTLTLRDGRSITIRLLEATDGEAVVSFYADIPNEDGKYCFSPSSRTRSKALERVVRADAAREVCLVLADAEGQIHGEAWYQWGADDAAQSTLGITIRRTMQGVGAGRLLTQRLLEVGDIYGPPIMNLTAQVENTRAWKLYTSLGFVILRQQMREVREDSPEMPEFYMERKMGRRC